MTLKPLLTQTALQQKAILTIRAESHRLHRMVKDLLSVGAEQPSGIQTSENEIEVRMDACVKQR